MMPTLFIPLPVLPTTVTGKLDRKKLRSIVCNFSVDEIQSYTASYLIRQASSHNQKSEPGWESTTPELTLAQELWIEALGLSVESKVQMNPLSNFFDLGGDSVVAMRLVALCRSRCQRQIGVADIYERPTLMDLAFALRESTDTVSRIPSSPATAPFSMLGPWRQHSAVLAAIHKQLPDVEIEDIYPCTAFQEGVMALSTQQQGSYVAKYRFALASADLDVVRLRNALRQVVTANSILRTRIVYVDGFGYFQAVLSASYSMEPLTGADGVIVRPWEQGSPLVQFSLAGTGPQPELWSYASHAVFDAVTWDLFSTQLNAAYRSKLEPNMIAPYAVFVHARARAGQEDDAEFQDFWIQTLEDAEHTAVFPDSRQDRVEVTQFFEFDMDMDVGYATRGITDATQLHAAWALTLSAFSASQDVVFGSVMSERSLGLQHGDNIMGPCVATVPVRSRLDQVRGFDLDTWLRGEQRHLLQVLSHAQIRPAQIERLNPRVLQFDTIIQIIIPSSEQRDNDLVKLISSGPAYDNSAGYFTTPLVLEMKPSKAKLSIEAIFNATVAPPHLVSNMVHTLLHIIKQLRSAGTGTSLADIKLYSPYHRDQIATYNSFTPQQAQSPAPQLISHWAQSTPTKIAIEAWDGVLTYSEVGKYASALAIYIQSNFALSPAEETIAICFSRSRWVPVAMLAVQQLRRAYLALDPSHPTKRLLQLVQQAGAKLILADTKQADRFAGLREVLTVDQQLQERLLAVHDDARLANIVDVRPSDPAIVVYTSGSTGLPKAILLQQRALSSAIVSYGSHMDFGRTTRTLQNAAFAFDIHACEIFFTLAHGGCLVIADAANDLAYLGATIREHDINWLFMTPSTMHLLPHSDEIPSVKTLMMIGEAPTRSIVGKWADPTKLHLINAYGPAENTLFSTMYSFRDKHEDPTTIGSPVGCTAWVVSPYDIDVLLPVGCMGELLLQGPQLAREYLSQSDETARKFVRALRWTSDFDVHSSSDARFYKTGDLVRQDEDGMLHFIGRIDSQVKLNGQRLELAEVEHYVSLLLQGVRVIAEIIEPQGGNPTLAVFIEDLAHSVIMSKEELTSKLHACLPSFMVPSLFVRVHELPQTSSKKLDRKALKAMGSSQNFQELNALAPASANAHRSSITTDVKALPKTPAECLLERLWRKVIALPTLDIGVDDNFFELGGNSIQAIRLATLISAEYRQPIRIPTSSIFQNPRLKDMAVLLEPQELHGVTDCPTVAATTISPELLDYCATSLAIPPASIQDIYPCTPLQERMLAASAVSPNAYMADNHFAAKVHF
jgi:amino acid adenylation domain-containing protein